MTSRYPRRIVATGDLNITSMMDMFTIILVFLLMSFATTDAQITPNPQLVLPSSAATDKVEVAVAVVVQRNQLLVDGMPILPLVGGSAAGGGAAVRLPDSAVEGAVIPALLRALSEKADAARALSQATQGADRYAFSGKLLLQIDKDIPFSVVRPILTTAGEAGFDDVRFVTYRGNARR